MLPMTVRMIGHGEIQHRDLEVRDFVGSLGRVEHLIEDDAVHRHHGIVPRDDLLARHIEHLLHHVHFGADPIDEGRDETEARRQAVRIAAETLDGIDIALRHDLDRLRYEDDRQKQNDDDESCAAQHWCLPYCSRTRP